MNERAVSPVMGIALLLGLTTVAALSMFLLTAVMLGDTQSSAEVRQAEESLGSFAQSADRIAEGQVDEADFDLTGSQDPSVRVEEDAGSYEVRIERSSGTEVLTNGSLGAYRYETDESSLAYQGGGVWRRDATGDAQLVQAPEFHYRADPVPTLTLPVVRFDGDDSDPATSGRVEVVEQRDVYPTEPNHENPLDDGTVFLDVESEFCEGWELFFATRTDGAVVERCDDTDETVEGEVQVKLSVPFHFDGLGSETAIAEQITGVGTVHGSTAEGPHDVESATGVVEDRVEFCEDYGTNLTTSVTGGGTYCEHDDMDEDTYTFDPEGEDVEVVVDGRFEPRDLEIVGDGSVTVFVHGPALPMPGDTIGNASHPERLRIVVKSGCAVGGIPGPCGGGPRGGGHMDIHALIYAPNSVVDFAGNVDLHGGVVADTIDLQSGASSVHPDPAVQDVELEFERGGEPFYYLHVTETTVRVAE